MRGGYIALFLAKHVAREKYNIEIPKIEFEYMITVCWVCFALLLGIFQNIIRRIRGRQIRPIFDVALIRHNLSKWKIWIRK